MITRRLSEDFGKRNMPGKRARRHFSQLNEFERGLIIGMKTAGWSTHRVAGQEHRQLRLQWCQARSMWNATDRQKVVLRDESRLVLGADDNRVRVWRRPGERYNSSHTVPRHTARTARVIVWGA
ncbi:transposable element Tcb2 transposase [Trichonephila clavipes]|nr:transposable element Tcb2 transposase [Trichonephila clavipes]